MRTGKHDASRSAVSVVIGESETLGIQEGCVGLAKIDTVKFFPDVKSVINTATHGLHGGSHQDQR